MNDIRKKYKNVKGLLVAVRHLLNENGIQISHTYKVCEIGGARFRTAGLQLVTGVADNRDIVVLRPIGNRRNSNKPDMSEVIAILQNKGFKVNIIEKLDSLNNKKEFEYCIDASNVVREKMH